MRFELHDLGRVVRLACPSVGHVVFAFGRWLEYRYAKSALPIWECDTVPPKAKGPQPPLEPFVLLDQTQVSALVVCPNLPALEEFRTCALGVGLAKSIPVCPHIRSMGSLQLP